MDAPANMRQLSPDALAPTAVVGVIGAGTMGAGIAQVAAAAGHRVRLYDVHAGQIDRALTTIGKDLEALAARGKLSAQAAAEARARVQPAAQLTTLADCDLVIEAAIEDLALKQALFAELESIVPTHAILATNTSSLSITAIAAKLRQPERVVGMHFFNPPPRMRLVEIVSGVASSSAALACVTATAQAWGKVTVAARSTPGFIVNRLARPFYAEAWRVLREHARAGAAPSPQLCANIDALLREAGGYPMGPFELMDLIGHDVNLAVTQSVFEATHYDRRYMPALEQQELVRAGRLGRKSGQGVYVYGAEDERVEAEAIEPDTAAMPATIAHGAGSLIAPLVARLAQSGLALRLDARLDPDAMDLGTGMLALTDGRCATERAVAAGRTDVVLFDLAADFAVTPRLGLAAADGCGEASRQSAVACLARAGIAAVALDDVPGLVVMRTVAMLVNEAFDAVHNGVCAEADIDAATRHGLNHPRGPREWSEHLGIDRVAQVLAHLHQHYGEERYRVSPLIKRRQAARALTESRR